MNNYEIEFFHLSDGCEPANEFISSLEPKMKAKTLKILDILQANGPQLRMPYSKYLRNDIFEIRIKSGTNIARILYFFVVDGKIVLTNGFIKKSIKTPKSELEKAIKYKKEYERSKFNGKL